MADSLQPMDCLWLPPAPPPWDSSARMLGQICHSSYSRNLWPEIKPRVSCSQTECQLNINENKDQILISDSEKHGERNIKRPIFIFSNIEKIIFINAMHSLPCICTQVHKKHIYIKVWNKMCMLTGPDLGNMLVSSIVNMCSITSTFF